MSVTSISSDSDYDDDSIDQFSPSRSSFTTWGYVQLLSSSLYPPSCELRPIANKGSIRDSIIESKIDLFDRVTRSENILIKLARSVAIAVAFVFIHLAIAPLGTFYHAANLIKYTILCGTGIGNPESNLKGFSEHGYATLQDFFHGIGPMIIVSPLAPLGLLATAGAAALATLAIFGPDLIDIDKTVCYEAYGKDRYGFSKSMLLRNRFGIVDAETKGFLPWSPSKDADVTIKRTYGSYFYGSYELDGHFATLRKEQAVKLLEAIQSLQSSLLPDCRIPSFYPPSVETIFKFLKSNQAASGLTPTQLLEWKDKLQTIENNMQAIWGIINDSYTASSREIDYEFGATVYRTYSLEDSFPIPKDECEKYY